MAGAGRAVRKAGSLCSRHGFSPLLLLPQVLLIKLTPDVLQPSALSTLINPTAPTWNWCSSSPVVAFQTRAVKSAEAVAAITAASLRTQDQTAPLWPWKVPTQSPVSPLRSMGWPSLLAEARKMPSGVTGLHRAAAAGWAGGGH